MYQSIKTDISEKNLKKRNARQQINSIRDFFNEISYALMKYHLRYCLEKIQHLENLLKEIQTQKKKFKFKNIKRPPKDYKAKERKDLLVGRFVNAYRS